MDAKNKTPAKTSFKLMFKAFLLPQYEPIIPPKTANNTQERSSKSNAKFLLKLPKSPAIEFRKMNKAETQAISFTFPHEKISMMGVKIIPPPIPIIPLTNPSAAPINNPKTKGISFTFSEEFLPKTPKILKTAKIKQMPRICLYKVGLIVNKEPTKVIGIDNKAKG